KQIIQRKRVPGKTSSDHAATNVSGKALPCAAQVHGVDARQVIPPETELGHRQQAGKKDAECDDRNRKLPQVDLIQINDEKRPVIYTQKECEHKRHEQ